MIVNFINLKVGLTTWTRDQWVSDILKMSPVLTSAAHSLRAVFWRFEMFTYFFLLYYIITFTFYVGVEFFDTFVDMNDKLM